MNVLITGSTGMVGKSVLNECIKDDRIGKIYLINRVPVNLKSSKVSEFILDNFLKMGELKNEFKSLFAMIQLFFIMQTPFLQV